MKAITYGALNATFRKSLRNGNWIRLRSLDKALYKAAMWYAKYHCTTNGKLVEKLLGLVAKLLEKSGARVFRSGHKSEELNIINHTSQIMHYQSHITDYTLLITHYASRITHHRSHITPEGNI
jgi:hypothetical protein